MTNQIVEDFEDVLAMRQKLQREIESWQEPWDSLIKKRYELLQQIEERNDYWMTVEDAFIAAGAVITPEIRKKLFGASEKMSGLKDRVLESDNQGVQLKAELDELTKRAADLIEKERKSRDVIQALHDAYIKATSSGDGKKTD